MGSLRRREKALFRTHKPPLSSPEWAVGQVVQCNGKLYQVTRWVELRPIRLQRGGSVGEWEVRGQKLSDKDIREELLRAAEQMLKS